MSGSQPDDSTQRWAVVTGASSGIGALIARGLVARGMPTLMVARRADRLNALADELRTTGECETLAADLSDRDAVRNTVLPRLRERHVGVLINNAGFGVYKPFLAVTPDEHDNLHEVNYQTPATLIRAVLPGMVDRGNGHVINVGSIAAVVGPWGHGSYAAAKAALRALTQSLAAEYSDKGVHFSAVLPGLIATEFFRSAAYQRMFQRVRRQAIDPAVAAQRILKLLDRPRLELTIPGHFRAIAVIAAVAPHLAHRMVRKRSRPTDDPQPAPRGAKPVEGAQQ